MLVLTRKLDEAVNISEDITVHVLGVNGNQVKIGIDAPKEIKIDRVNSFPSVKSSQTTLSLNYSK